MDVKKRQTDTLDSKHLSELYAENKNNRRESLPLPELNSLINQKSKNKARSMSPPKTPAIMSIKPFKVKIERNKLLALSPRGAESSTNNLHSSQKQKLDNDRQKTPTKAQQKLFEPIKTHSKPSALMQKKLNIRKCLVRVHRDNLMELMRQHQQLKDKSPTNAAKAPVKRATKRPASTNGPGDSPPAQKKDRLKPNFFIKLGNPKQDKKGSKAMQNKVKNSKTETITTPTRLSRSQLIQKFGQRAFKCYVRIAKSTHPVMAAFDSNARARRLQSKRNKSKNLSVSFRDQVEVFGDGSDSDDSVDENFCAIPPPSSMRNNRVASRRSAGSDNNSVVVSTAPESPVVMPARLKKIENGKVVDEIELDPSLFLVPKDVVASTPYSPGRKKRDRKSFSPLKDEATPSPRKEQLKLANERIPPTGLRRLKMDDEEEEDDDCEYIVPIELPERRNSRASSTNTVDGQTTETESAQNDKGNDSESDCETIEAIEKEINMTIANGLPLIETDLAKIIEPLRIRPTVEKTPASPSNDTTVTKPIEVEVEEDEKEKDETEKDEKEKDEKETDEKEKETPETNHTTPTTTTTTTTTATEADEMEELNTSTKSTSIEPEATSIEPEATSIEPEAIKINNVKPISVEDSDSRDSFLSASDQPVISGRKSPTKQPEDTLHTKSPEINGNIAEKSPTIPAVGLQTDNESVKNIKLFFDDDSKDSLCTDNSIKLKNNKIIEDPANLSDTEIEESPIIESSELTSEI